MGTALRERLEIASTGSAGLREVYFKSILGAQTYSGIEFPFSREWCPRLNSLMGMLALSSYRELSFLAGWRGDSLRSLKVLMEQCKGGLSEALMRLI